MISYEHYQKAIHQARRAKIWSWIAVVAATVAAVNAILVTAGVYR